MRIKTLKIAAVTIAMAALVCTGCAKETPVEDVAATEQASEEVSATANETLTEASAELTIEDSEKVEEASSEASTEVISTEKEEAATVETTVIEAVENQTNTSENITTDTSTVTASKDGIPQEYNGDPEGRGPGRIIVKGFDYNDVYQGMAWKGDYWTASNGVEIKVIPIEGNIYERLPVPDGKGLDNAPGSPFRVACNEAAGTASDKFNAVSETIPVTSFKRSSIDTSDGSLLAFKNSYDSHYGGYSGGGAANASLNVFSDGVADVDNLGATFWSIRREGDYWKLQINSNLDAWRWSGVHQILRYLSPDGEAIYNAIYDCFYTGGENYDVWDAYDTWETIGNSQCYLGSSNSGGVWYFK